MIIDIHTHLAFYKIFPEEFLKEISLPLMTGDETHNAFVRQIMKNSLNDCTGEMLINAMDKSGIDKSILLIADFGYSMGEAELSLKEMYKLHLEVKKRFPDRFILFGGVDPRRGRDSIDFFEQSIDNYCVKGLKLYPPCGFELDDPSVYPLYDICSSYEIPILTHTGPSLDSMRTERNYPESILKVSAEYPSLNFILGHAGAREIDQTIDIISKRENILCDISTFQVMMGKDEMVFNFAKLTQKIPDKLLFGTDFPMFTMSTTQKQLVDIVDLMPGLSSKNKEKLFSENAKRILNIDEVKKDTVEIGINL